MVFGLFSPGTVLFGTFSPAVVLSGTRTSVVVSGGWGFTISGIFPPGLVFGIFPTVVVVSGTFGFEVSGILPPGLVFGIFPPVVVVSGTFGFEVSGMFPPGLVLGIFSLVVVVSGAFGFDVSGMFPPGLLLGIFSPLVFVSGVCGFEVSGIITLCFVLSDMLSVLLVSETQSPHDLLDRLILVGSGVSLLDEVLDTENQFVSEVDFGSSFLVDGVSLVIFDDKMSLSTIVEDEFQYTFDEDWGKHTCTVRILPPFSGKVLVYPLPEHGILVVVTSILGHGV